MARSAYWLTPPTRLTFTASLVLVILALLVRYAHVAIPLYSAHVFETLWPATSCCSWGICSGGCESHAWFCFR